MKSKLKCLVIDDEPLAIEILEDYITRIPFLELVGSFRSALKAMAFVHGQAVDLVFLDIKMPDLSGIQFLKSLSHQPLVIFTTAYSEYAVESYDYQVVDYLLKPIEFDRFLKAANKALKQSEPLLSQRTPAAASRKKAHKDGQDLLVLKSGTDYHPLQIDDILYIEGAGNYIFVFTTKKRVMALMNLKEALKSLPAASEDRDIDERRLLAALALALEAPIDRQADLADGEVLLRVAELGIARQVADQEYLVE